MTRKEELREAYEDALFALLMEEMEHPEPSRTIHQPGGEVPLHVPDDVDDACHEILKQDAARQRRQKAGRSVRRVLTLIAAAALAAVLLLTTAFAVSEDFRVNTLNLLIEISDVSARLTVSGASSAPSGQEQSTAEAGQTDAVGAVLMGYQLPQVPDGFEAELAGEDEVSAWIRYKNEAGATICFMVSASGGAGYYVDTEGAGEVKEISINGGSGFLVEKGDLATLCWVDPDQLCYIQVVCEGISADAALILLENVHFVGP